MIPVYEHEVRLRDVWAVARQMLYGSIGPHKRVEELERLISARYRDRDVVVTTSGTTALMLSLWVADLRRDDVVLVPAWTNHAAADAARMLGLRVRLVDVDPQTGCMCMESLKGALIRHAAKAVVLVHHNGPFADATSAKALCDRHGAVLIEDACQAFGWLNRITGLVAAFSFAPMKLLTTGQGGCVITDDAVTADLLRDIRGSGRHDGGIGGNFRMPDVLAAWGIAQMQRFDWTLIKRARLHTWFCTGGIQVPFGSWCVVYRSQQATALGEHLERRGVGAARFFSPIWTRREYQAAVDNFPGACEATDTWVYLPSGPRLTRKQVATVCCAVREFRA